MLGNLLCENHTKGVKIPWFWFKFEVQAKLKGEIKIVGISGVNFGN